MLSASDIHNRKFVFLEQFKSLRKRKPALLTARMKYKQFVRFMENDEIFRSDVDSIQSHLDSTVRCSSCKYIGPPHEFIHLNSSLTRSGRCKRCHSERQTTMRRSNLGYKLVKLIQDAKARDISARQLNVKILRLKFLNQCGKCFYTGLPMSWDVCDGMEKVRLKEFSTIISIDRLDPNFGYSPENVVLCCFSANLMKGGLQYKAFLTACKQVLEHAS